MAKLSREFLEALATPITDVYNHIERELIINISRHFNANNAVATTEWQLKKLAEIGQLTKENIKIIANATGQIPELTQIALESAAWESLKGVEPAFAAAVKAGYISGATQSASESIIRALTAYQQQATDALNLVNTTMLKSSLEAYRKTVANISVYEQQYAKTQEVLNNATGEVVTGITSHTQAVRKAITELSDAGITAFIDKAGRNWSAEAYVNMDIRTTVNNVANQAVMNRAEDYGTSLFEISSHAGARPKCAIDQGKIVSKDNASGYVKDVYGNKIRYIPLSQTSYGEPDGILGINCGHHLSPIIPGHFVKRSEETENYEENAQQYKESQQQRALERKVRQDKTAADALKAAGDTEGYTKAAAKVKADNDKLKAFCAETGRTYRNDRVQVYASQSGFTSLLGTVTANGTKITEIATHLGDSLYKAERGNVSVSGILNALTNPLKIGKMVTDEYGRNSQQYIGANATVVVNPDIGKICTYWQTSRSLISKIIKGGK